MDRCFQATQKNYRAHDKNSRVSLGSINDNVYLCTYYCIASKKKTAKA